MATRTLDAKLQKLLGGWCVATLATEISDGSIHRTAVWYLGLGVPALRYSRRPDTESTSAHTSNRSLIEV